MYRYLIVGAILGWLLPGPVQAQDVEELFRKVNPSVLVIKAKGRDVVSTRGLVTFGEIGSGVLISADGKVMTAAHVVHAMDEIIVEFLGGETVPARVVAWNRPLIWLCCSWHEFRPGRRWRDSATPIASGWASRSW